MKNSKNALIGGIFLLVAMLSLSACNKQSTWQDLYDLGMKYLEEGDYEEAVNAFRVAFSIDEKKQQAYIGAADAYMGMAASGTDGVDVDKCYAAAEENYRKVLEKDSANGDVYQKLADVYAGEQDTKKTEELLEEARENGQEGTWIEEISANLAPVEIGYELNQFLTMAPSLENDWDSIMWGLVENYTCKDYYKDKLVFCGREGDYSIYDGKGIGEVLETYYGVPEAEGSPWKYADDYEIVYKDGKYYGQMDGFYDLAYLGTYVNIAETVENLEDGTYKVKFAKYWIWPDLANSTGDIYADEDNPLWEEDYYGYTIQDIEADKFCEKQSGGEVIVRRNLKNGQLNVVLD